MKKAAERLEKNGAGMNLGGNFTVVVSYCNFNFMNVAILLLAFGVQEFNREKGWRVLIAQGFGEFLKI